MAAKVGSVSNSKILTWSENEDFDLLVALKWLLVTIKQISGYMITY